MTRKQRKNYHKNRTCGHKRGTVNGICRLCGLKVDKDQEDEFKAGYNITLVDSKGNERLIG